MDEDYYIIKVRRLISDMPRLGSLDRAVAISRAANGYVVQFRGLHGKDEQLVAADVHCLLAVILHLYETRDEEALPPGFFKGSMAYESGYAAGEADGRQAAAL